MPRYCSEYNRFIDVVIEKNQCSLLIRNISWVSHMKLLISSSNGTLKNYSERWRASSWNKLSVTQTWPCILLRSLKQLYTIKVNFYASIKCLYYRRNTREYFSETLYWNKPWNVMHIISHYRKCLPIGIAQSTSVWWRGT